MKKINDEEKTKLLNQAITLIDYANFLLDQCYQSHCKELEKRKKVDK